MTDTTHQAAEPLCACKDRPASQCDEEWGPNCDLGNNPAHVRVSPLDPATLLHQAAEPAPIDRLSAELRSLGYSDTAINAMGSSTTMMQRSIDAKKMLMGAQHARDFPIKRFPELYKSAEPAPSELVSRMVDRFLGWPLPKTFAPDCGISFDGRKDDEWNKGKTWPVGTNLFTAEEATALFTHAVAGVAPSERAQAAIRTLELLGCTWAGPGAKQWAVPMGSFAEHRLMAIEAISKGHCINCGSNVDPKCACPNGRKAAMAASPAPLAEGGDMVPSDLAWNLHPRTTDLVNRFSYALAGKLAAAEKKYGYSDGWAESDWIDECRDKLMDHIDKGDPRDVAAYCAFLWHHGASTRPTRPTISDIAGVFDEGVRQGAALAAAPPAPTPGTLSDEVISGALYDFMGFLTTSETRWTFSAYDEASPAVHALEQWAAKRGLSLENANVPGWRAAIAAQASQEAKK